MAGPFPSPLAPTLVTPEAVALELEVASVGSRIVAKLIDLAIEGALAFGVALSAAATGAHFGGVGIGLLYLFGFLLLFGYPAAFETLWRGRTPGKAALGLRVVTVEGAPVRFRHAAIRAVLGLVDFYLTSGAVAVLAVFFSSRSQRLGDLVAGTVVLRERTGLGVPAPVTFRPPPGLEGYTASLDLAGLTAADYGTVRAFLLRVSTLSPAVRLGLSQRLAQSLALRVAPPPPPGLHPEVFLVCIAAAYQLRQARRPPASTGTGTAGAGRPSAPPPAPPPAPASTPEAGAEAEGDGFAPLA